MQSYDINKPITYLDVFGCIFTYLQLPLSTTYLSANNLYDCAMIQCLPYVEL